jgi:FlgN protein
MFTAHQFVELLSQQTELLDRLIESGRQQQLAIDASRMSELIAILAEKQPHLEQLGQIREQLHERRADIERSDFWPDSDVRQLGQTLRDRAAQAFQTLIDLEQDCEKSLSRSRDQIQLRLQSVESGRVAASAYQSQAVANVVLHADFSSVG